MNGTVLDAATLFRYAEYCSTECWQEKVLDIASKTISTARLCCEMYLQEPNTYSGIWPVGGAALCGFLAGMAVAVLLGCAWSAGRKRCSGNSFRHLRNGAGTTPQTGAREANKASRRRLW